LSSSSVLSNRRYSGHQHRRSGASPYWEPPPPSSVPAELVLRYDSYMSDLLWSGGDGEGDRIMSDFVQYAERCFYGEGSNGRPSPSGHPRAMNLLGVRAVEMALSVGSTSIRRAKGQGGGQGSGGPRKKRAVVVPVRLVTESLRILSKLRDDRPTAGRPKSVPARAYALLQFLVSGRCLASKTARGGARLTERDFSAVLNSCANHASPYHMRLARRVALLQSRSGIRRSVVTYCILVKGYGRAGMPQAVDGLLFLIMESSLRPDVVLMNAVVDAYVRCGLFDRADYVLRAMEDRLPFAPPENRKSAVYSKYPPANVRTYNTLLKGLSIQIRTCSSDQEREKLLTQMLKMVEKMRRKGLWGADPITTNTVVDAAVRGNNFELAEDILHETTCYLLDPNPDDCIIDASHKAHKHVSASRYVEAYTALLNGYARSGEISRAMEVLKSMQEVGADPNTVTYTCLIAGLARAARTDEAFGILRRMEAKGLPVSAVTYNSFLSGLIAAGAEDDQYDQDEDDVTLLGHARQELLQHERGSTFSEHSRVLLSPSERADAALALLRRMERTRVAPTPSTAALLVDATTRNVFPPPLRRASDLVRHLERSGQVPRGHPVPYTALLGACRDAGDVAGALTALGAMRPGPDTVALNAFLDVCCRSRDLRLALEVFGKYAGGVTGATKGGTGTARAGGHVDDGGGVDTADENDKERKINPVRPDVITFSTLIVGIGKLDQQFTGRKMQKMYQLMRDKWNIYPDKELVDGLVECTPRVFYTLICLTRFFVIYVIPYPPLRILELAIGKGGFGLTSDDITFISLVMKEAKALDWAPGAYEERLREVKTVIVGRVSEVWKENEESWGMSWGKNERIEDTPDDLFKKKGWNKVDSGFRLWGDFPGIYPGRQDTAERGPNKKRFEDDLLSSKGWNELDSGFRFV